MKVHHPGGYKSRDNDSNDLRPEGLTGWNLDIVGQFQVISERKSMSRCHITRRVLVECFLHRISGAYPKHLKKFIASALPGFHAPPINSARTLQNVVRLYIWKEKNRKQEGSILELD